MRMSYAAVKAFLDSDFVSPLCHGAKSETEIQDLDKQIVAVKVLWSESGVFNRALRNDGDDINQEIAMSEYNRLAALTIMEFKSRGLGGYYKTKVELTTARGEKCTFRHDICPKEPTLSGEWAEWVDYCRSEDGKKAEEEVKAIREAQNQKAAVEAVKQLEKELEEKEQPQPAATTRKLVSLGDYQERTEAKKERIEARAAKAQEQSNSHYATAHELGNILPFGQPILVGHHSESKHRRLIANIDNNMSKSVEAQKKADYLEAKAESVGTAGIASDDPEAIQKLKDKLNNLTRSQEMMKAINKVIRSKHTTDADKIEYMMHTHQITEKHAKELLKGDFAGRVGFPSYALQNNNATINTTKKRLEELEKLHNEAPLEDQGQANGTEWTLYEEDGRIKFAFDAIPSDEVRGILKSNGFKWSRFSKAWVRKMTGNAVRTTKRVIEQLKAID